MATSNAYKFIDVIVYPGDTPITFVGNSYARWTLLDPIDTRLSLSMRIKTLRESASLMFAKGRVDYSILEVSDNSETYFSYFSTFCFHCQP